jgi:benzoyl-CoA reductase/2-hydroxyglutaryl-CoA dehydratase subunit BcrC/BadD/HgdB
MTEPPRQLSLDEWDARYAALTAQGLREPAYGGSLRRHADDGDLRLRKLRYDNSPAALRLWNFLLTEEDRLHAARTSGRKLVGAMKDLGTVPVMAYALPNVVAFYPDGAWWIPCVMEMSARLLEVADSLGIDESFCPVRAMLGAFVTEAHFPIPDLITCNVGATCDDFSAIAQRLNGLGYPILWWETPHRRTPEPDEPAVDLPGGFRAPASQVAFVRSELDRVRAAIEHTAGARLNDTRLSEGIRIANRVRRTLAELRLAAYAAPLCPMPALEMLIAEMMAIHFCSDRDECLAVLEDLLREVRRRVKAGLGVSSEDAARVYWVNPVADLRVMNFLESCGGRICGTEYLFCHAIDQIPEDVPPMEALARMALADPMIGPASDRADRICRDVVTLGAEAVLISRIPGASHCATEGDIIRATVHSRLGIPVAEIEVPPVCDAVEFTLRTRLDALVEMVLDRRKR